MAVIAVIPVICAVSAAARAAEQLFEPARVMLKDVWGHRLTQGESQAKTLAKQLLKIERQ